MERLFAKLKEFRRVATRYEELKQTFLGMIHLALRFIRLRAEANVNTASYLPESKRSGRVEWTGKAGVTYSDAITSVRLWLLQG